MSQTEETIDFIISWVDGNDAKWCTEKNKYEKERIGDDREERYRDWNMLKFWFRGVEKYAPWVRRIHFVTCGQVPKWLNSNHPKIHVVRHEDYIPSQYLPTFNSHTIELNFHRIPGLAKHFVYFNDDMFLIKKVKPNDFFVNGLPRDMLALQPVVVKPDNTMMAHIFLNNTIVISKYFNKRENVKNQPLQYFKIGYPIKYFIYNMLELFFPLFSGFYTVHGASPLCKETYYELWEKEENVLDQACKHKFRSKEDVNQYLLREWQKLKGNFCAKNITKDFCYFEVDNENAKLIDTIKKQKVKVICINDTNSKIDFETVKTELQRAFEIILPEKSFYEHN
ncbi:MAG: Stealth CR1 domain-containing protein [Velocimicrobium sp.]